MKYVLFVCEKNAGRSQMAEGLFTNQAPRGWMAISAGTEPAEKVHPAVVEVMQEVGVDLRRKEPQKLTTEMIEKAEKVFTVCDIKDYCPAPLLPKVEHWELEDPKDKPISRVREIREDIKKKVVQLIWELRENG